MPTVAITEFTDPGCPFAFSAEPHRLRLRWLFGDQLQWHEKMVGLAATRSDYEAKGFTAERTAASWKRLARSHGMPMSEEVKPAVAATLPACRAVVAARLHAPGQAWALLRALRRLHFAGPLLDDPQTIRTAASQAGLDPEVLEAWMAEPATEEALREDLRQARDPTPAASPCHGQARPLGRRLALHLPELRDGRGGRDGFSAPGLQSALTYETALANLAPDLDAATRPGRRGGPGLGGRAARLPGGGGGLRDLPRRGPRAPRGRRSPGAARGNDGFWSVAG
jgi:predicted DsbA family dithiol-disulfide isomerase